MSNPIELTDAEIKEELWAWNDFQDSLEHDAPKEAISERGKAE